MQKCVLENSEVLRIISHEFHIYKQPWLNNSSRSQGFLQAHGLETRPSAVLPRWLGTWDTASPGEVSNLWSLSVINPLLSPKAIFLCPWHYHYLWWSEERGGGGTQICEVPMKGAGQGGGGGPSWSGCWEGTAFLRSLPPRGGAQSEAACLLSSVLMISRQYPGNPETSFPWPFSSGKETLILILYPGLIKIWLGI